MQLRPFRPDDAKTNMGWCKDKHAFRHLSADMYEDFPVRPEEMMKQYDGQNMHPLTAIVGEEIVGHIFEISTRGQECHPLGLCDC